MKRLAFCLLITVLGSEAFPQPLSSAENLERIVQYLGIDKDPQFLAEVNILLQKVEDRSETEAGRVQRMREVFFHLSKKLGYDTIGHNQSIISWAQRQTVRNNLPIFEDISYAPTPTGTLAEVIKSGSGKISVILIPEYRKNYTMFDEMVTGNSKDYTFYVLTLPGYNGTAPYSLPPTYDFAQRVWLNNVVDGIIALINSEKLKAPVIVGALDAGSYIAVNVAARLQNKIRGVILLNGALRETLENNPEPTQRINVINKDLSNVFWYLFTRRTFTAEQLQTMARRKVVPNHPSYYYTKDTVKVKHIIQMHNSFPSLTERYNLEWQTADLTLTVQSLKVPMLVALSVYDQDWPFEPKTNERIEVWKKFKYTNPNVPLTITEVANARLLLTFDRPEVVLGLLNDFVMKKVITGKIQ